MESPTTIIEPGRNIAHYWRDLWRYRDLMGFLAWRDIKVRYRQAVLGVAWAVIQPAIQTFVLTFVFSRLAGFSDAKVPYSLVVLCGLLPWQFFAAAFSSSGNSILSNGHLVSKVYFPRLIIPLSALAVSVVDASILFMLTLGYAACVGVMPTWSILLLPAYILPLLIITLGCGLWTTVLTIKYRDFRFIMPLVLQIGLFVTPVGFRSSGVGDWGQVLQFNPLTGVVEGFRWCLLGSGTAPALATLAISYAVGLLLLGSGLAYFRASEKQFADIL